MSPAPKEQVVEQSIDDLLGKIGECLSTFVATLDAYLANEDEKAWGLWKELDAKETEADGIRRSIVKTLYEGAFLPMTREDLMRFAEAADKIADAAESASDEIVLTRPAVPDVLKPEIKHLAHEAVAGLPVLREATMGIFSDFATAMAKAEEVGANEHAADQIEWQLVRNLFAMDIDLSQKLHLRQVIESIGNIADRTEDAADRLESLLVKKPY